jgi:hypothetical protein
MNDQHGGAGGEAGGQGTGEGAGGTGEGGQGAPLEGGQGQESTQQGDVTSGQAEPGLVETQQAANADDLNEQGGPTGIQAEVDASTGEQHPPSDPMEPTATAQDVGHPTREEREREASEQAERDRVAAQQNEDAS